MNHFTGHVTLNASVEVPDGTEPQYALEDLAELIWKHLPTEPDVDQEGRIDYVSFVDTWEDVVRLHDTPRLMYTPETSASEQAFVGYLKAHGYEGQYLHGPTSYVVDRQAKEAEGKTSRQSKEDFVRTADLDEAIDYVRYAVTSVR